MIITRIPPSPTGNLHLWTARTALYNWLLARQQWWRFLFRTEDTDTTRSTKFFEKDIMDGLRWLWLDWDVGPDKEDDKGPYTQMQRLDIYDKYIKQLIDEGKAYYAWESTEELDQMREESNKQKKPFVYRKINYTQTQIDEFKAQWREPVVRFEVSPEITKWNDLVKWEVSFDMSLVWDFVILKSDWIPTYYLANVVDDHLMWVTHIIRWEDHVPNTPKQILLFKWFWWDIPEFWHLPLLLNPNKAKMSKRDTQAEFVTITKFREEWFLPQALINFVALLGWHTADDKEFFDMNQLIKEFSVERINNSNAIYDFSRALWFNWEYIRNMEDKDFVEFLLNYLEQYWDQEWKWIINITEKSYWMKLAPYIKVRLQTFGQFKDYAKYFFKRQFPEDEILYNPKMRVDEQTVKAILNDIISILENTSDWTEENIKQTIVEYVEKKWLKNWQVLWPIRAILTWVQASPWAFEMLYVIWKQESISRLKEFKGMKNF